jgi:hypothetical protein
MLRKIFMWLVGPSRVPRFMVYALAINLLALSVVQVKMDRKHINDNKVHIEDWQRLSKKADVIKAQCADATNRCNDVSKSIQEGRHVVVR